MLYTQFLESFLFYKRNSLLKIEKITYFYGKIFANYSEKKNTWIYPGDENLLKKIYTQKSYLFLQRYLVKNYTDWGVFLIFSEIKQKIPSNCLKSKKFQFFWYELNPLYNQCFIIPTWRTITGKNTGISDWTGAWETKYGSFHDTQLYSNRILKCSQVQKRL
jgi:hypothetical protein